MPCLPTRYLFLLWIKVWSGFLNRAGSGDKKNQILTTDILLSMALNKASNKGLTIVILQ